MTEIDIPDPHSRPRRVHPSDQAAVTAAALPVLGDLRAQGLTHRWVRALTSSQAFALNLFAGLAPDGLRRLAARTHGIDPSQVESAADPVFEWTDPQDRLSESSPARPHRTQIDVRLDAVTVDQARLVTLVEVKLTESDFGSCSAATSPHNPNLDVCASPGMFGGQPDRCFQLANHGHGHRRYHDVLRGVSNSADARITGAGCWVRASLSQPMRNLALAESLLADGDADRAAFAVCAPFGHQVIWRRFAEFRQVFPDETDRVSTALPAEWVAGLHPDRGAELARRYPDPVLQHLSPTGSTRPDR